MSDRVRRKLTTILAADAEGYSRAMEADEVRALGDLKAARRVFTGSIERHDGRIANTAGDGLIAEFPSVVEAVQAAVEIQRELGARDDGGLRFRIGIHLGDVLVDGGDLLGEGVNLAARLQSMAEPGGILVSQPVYDQVHAKMSVGFVSLGGRRPRNFAHDVVVYRIDDGAPAGAAGREPAAGPGTPPATLSPPANGDGRRPFSADGNLWRRLVRRARIFAAIAVALAAIDLATGSGVWVQWPLLAFAVILGLEAAPLLARGPFDVHVVRGVVVIAGLAVLNALTWEGDPWFVWPAGALVVAGLVRRIAVRTR